jgi:hypothetical protein
LRASCNAGKVFHAHGGRPADVWIDDHPLHAAGLAIDVTIVSALGRPPGSAAAAAEARKRDKYRKELDRHPGLGFLPLAIDTRGDIGPGAWDALKDLARIHAMQPAASRSYSEALDWVSGIVAAAFVDGCVRHIRIFDEWQRMGRACPPRADIHHAKIKQSANLFNFGFRKRTDAPAPPKIHDSESDSSDERSSAPTTQTGPSTGNTSTEHQVPRTPGAGPHGPE